MEYLVTVPAAKLASQASLLVRSTRNLHGGIVGTELRVDHQTSIKDQAGIVDGLEDAGVDRPLVRIEKEVAFHLHQLLL